MSVVPPPNPNVDRFNNTYWTSVDAGSLSIAELETYFLAFPSAQGTENLLATNTLGQANFYADIAMIGSGNSITFPDSSIQTTAYTGGPVAGDAVLANNQTFTGVNTFNNTGGIIIEDTTNTTTTSTLYQNGNNLSINSSVSGGGVQLGDGTYFVILSTTPTGLAVNKGLNVSNGTNSNSILLKSDATTTKQLDVEGQVSIGNPTNSNTIVLASNTINNNQLNINGSCIITNGTNGTLLAQSNGNLEISTSTTGKGILLKDPSTNTSTLSVDTNGFVMNNGLSTGSDIYLNGLHLAKDGNTNGLNIIGAGMTIGNTTNSNYSILASDTTTNQILNITGDATITTTKTYGGSYPTQSLATIGYVNGSVSTSLLGTNNTWTGTNAFSTSIPTTLTATAGDNSTSLATTAFVQTAITGVGDAVLSAGTVASPQNWTGQNYFDTGFNMDSGGYSVFTLGLVGTPVGSGLDISQQTSYTHTTFTNNYGSGTGQFNWNLNQTISGGIGNKNLMLLKQSQFRLNNCVQPTATGGFLNVALNYDINTGLSVYSLNGAGNTPNGLLCYSSSISGSTQTDTLYYKITTSGTKQYDTAGNLWQSNPSPTAVATLPNQINGLNMNYISPLSTSYGSQYAWYGYAPLGSTTTVQFLRCNGGGFANATNPAATSTATVGVGGADLICDGAGSLSLTAYNSTTTNAETRMTLSTGSFVLDDLNNGLQITIGQSGLSTDNPNGITLGSTLNMNSQNITNTGTISGVSGSNLILENDSDIYINGGMSSGNIYMSSTDGVSISSSDGGVTIGTGTGGNGAISLNSSGDVNLNSIGAINLNATAEMNFVTSSGVWISTSLPNIGDGDLYANFYGNLNGTATNATNATNSVNVAITDNNTSATYYPTFVSNNTGNLPLSVDKTTNPLSYIPSTGNLTSTLFTGLLSTGGLVYLSTGSVAITGSATFTNFNLSNIFNNTYKNYRIVLAPTTQLTFSAYPSYSLQAFLGTGTMPTIASLYGFEITSSSSAVVSPVYTAGATISSSPLILAVSQSVNHQTIIEVENVGYTTSASATQSVGLKCKSFYGNPGISGTSDRSILASASANSTITGLTLQQSSISVSNNMSIGYTIYGYK